MAVHSISGFRHGAVDSFALLEFCEAYVGSFYHPRPHNITEGRRDLKLHL